MVVEFEGVVVEDTSDLHSKAWMQLADAEGKPRPLQFALKRAEGMKNEQVSAMDIASAYAAHFYSLCVADLMCTLVA